MPIKECDARKMIVELAVISWTLRERIRVRELASTHRLERMLEEQEAWKRKAGFDRIKIIAEIHAQRLHAGFDSHPLYTGLYIPRWPHNLEKYKLKISVDVERLRLEISFSQSAPLSQCNPSPRRLPAVGMGSDEPEVPRADATNSGAGGNFSSSSQCRWLYTRQLRKEPGPGGCFTSSRHRGETETITTKGQVTAREEFARLTIGRQQRRTTSTE